MTILNVAIDGDVALVATNTEGLRLIGGRSCIASKVWILPAVSTVLSGRGQLALLFNVYCDLFAEMSGFDRMSDVLAASIAARHAKVVEESKSIDAPDAFTLEAEFVLVGWSERSGKMTALYYRVDAEGQLAPKVDFSDSGLVSPRESTWAGEFFPSVDADTMADLVRRQSALARDWPRSAMGGDILLAEIGRDSIKTTVVPL